MQHGTTLPEPTKGWQVHSKASTRRGKYDIGMPSLTAGTCTDDGSCVWGNDFMGIVTHDLLNLLPIY